MIPTNFAKRYFNDSELEQIERNGGVATKVCPVCRYDPKKHYSYTEPHTFRYQGVTYECPDDDYGHIALRLSKLYWLHNIPLEYQKLVWSEFGDETGQTEIFEGAKAYIDNFENYALNGVGMTLYSKTLGTGKTWVATAILKELVKRGVDGWFAPFYEVKSYYEIVDPEERAYKVKRVAEAPLLVLDEVKRPISKAQHDFLAERLEELLRPRSGMNLPTIITTNLDQDELEDLFPRAFSLMYAKNLFIEFGGVDARLGNKVFTRTVESAANGESLPIT